MSAGQTKFPKNPVPARQVHQRTNIVGRNGLPVDALATLEPGSVLVKGTTAYSYSEPTVTMDSSTDLSSLTNIIKTAKHTGVLLLTDDNNTSYFIDPDSVDNINNTFNIYIDAELTSSPTSIGNTGLWILSEAELVNRLQTTTTAVIDTVEFRDVNVNVDLDGSEVNIRDSDGDQLEVNQDGSINVVLISSDEDLSVHTFNEVSSVVSFTPTTINTYTVPPGKNSFLQKITVSGTNIADYRVKLNGLTIERLYTYFGSSLADNFNFLGHSNRSGYILNSGDVITVEVEHQRPFVGSFNSRIQVLEVNL